MQTAISPDIERLIGFIVSHGQHAEPAQTVGMLTVGSYHHSAQGGSKWVEEAIPATWRSARDWLGY